MVRMKTYARPCPNGCDRGWVWVAGVKKHCQRCKGRGAISVTMSAGQANMLSPKRPERRAQREQEQRKAS